jgi:hypothetical protein
MSSDDMSSTPVSNPSFDRYPFASQVVAPKTEAEVGLVRAWAEILSIPMESIGRDSSFVELGGDEVSAMYMVANACSQGMTLSVSDVLMDPRLFAVADKMVKGDVYSTHADQTAPFTLLKECERAAVLSARLRGELGLLNNDTVEDAYPCTTFQESLMALSLEQPDLHIAKNAYKLPEGVDLDRFKTSLGQVYQLLPNLRTMIVLVDKVPIQVVIKDSIRIDIVTEPDISSAVKAFGNHEMTYGSRLCRFRLVETASGETYFMWAGHRAVCDSWTLRLAWMSLSGAYAGKEVLPVKSYANFIKYTAEADCQMSKNFWSEYLYDEGGARFALPSWYRLSFPGLSSSGGPRMVKRKVKVPYFPYRQVMPATAIRAAWSIVLAQHCESDEVCFGAIVFGREVPLAGSEMIPGSMAATVPVRVHLDHERTVAEFLQGIESEATSMIPHQFFGLDRIGDISPNIKEFCDFTSLLVVQPSQHLNPNVLSPDEVPGLLVYGTSWAEEVLCGSPSERLIVQGDIYTDHIGLIIASNSSSMPTEHIVALAGHLQAALEQLMYVANASKSLGELFPTLSPQKPELLLFSAQSRSVLKHQVQLHENHLKSHAVHPRDLAHTLGVRREPLESRAFALLRKGCSIEISTDRKAPAQAPKITVVFSGQGAQWAGMGRELLRHDEDFAFDIGQMDGILRAVKNPPTWSIRGV